MPVASSETRGYMNRSHQTGRYRSGQTGQTVNLLALRLRWFESSPAQISLELLLGESSSLFVGHLHAGPRIRRRRSVHRRRRHPAAAARADVPRLQSSAGLPWFGR